MANSLKQDFVEAIKTSILSGKLRPGDRLPAERELAEMHSISRSSVNQGILDLERMGFLTIVPRKGTFVADYIRSASPETLASIMSFDSALIDRGLFIDLMDMRILIEREAVRLACGRVNSVTIKRMNESVQKIYSADAASLASALYDFHCTIIELSGNKAYYLTFQSFGKLLRKLIETHYSNSDELKVCLPLYNELAVAIKLSDKKRADNAISAILGRASQYLNSHLKEKNPHEHERF